MIVETALVDVDERVHVHITEAHATVGAPFPWARLGTPALHRYARGWESAGHRASGGRSFAALRSRSASSSAEPPNKAAVISSQRARKPSADSPVASR